MLGVDRQQPRPGLGGGGQHERPARDQRLLVGERQVGAGAERGQRGVEARGADDRVQHDVGVALLDEADNRVGAVLGGDADPLDAVQRGRGAEGIAVPASGERHDLQLGIVGADGQRLGADRPGGAEDRDPLHQVERYPGAGG